MWLPKLKQASRKKRKIAALHWAKRNWNLTLQLHKSNSDQLREELKLLLFICVLAGSAPIAVFPRYRSRCYDAVQQSWLIVLYAWLCFAAYWELLHGNIKLSDLEQKFYGIESMTYLIHVPCIMILSVSWKQKICAVFDRIAQFDLASGYIVERRNIGPCIRKHLLVVLILTSCYIPISYCFCQYEVNRTIIDLSTFVLPNILSGISFIPYFIMLQGVCRRMHCITVTLEAELRQEFPIQRDHLNQLRWQHINLLQFTKAVNQTFGVSILCVYVSSFFNVNTNLFLAYKNIENPDVSDWAWWTYILLWLFMHSAKVFIILFFNQAIQQEQTNCLTLLSKFQACSEDLLEAINHFMLQLQANVRAYVACGLIVLDYKFITALLMATTNVFIFFLQYEITYQALAVAANETKI
ncbi:putative gustatory receptor 59f [Drosophila nasuta]|uniref:putative gustatory receptor 59f n=1 Tax=Drosophila nasuta TaxID=42062 RepID=UPI00295EA027|nr:putative gustatory receptor 59f [Drosophila nasuta]